MSNVHTLNDIKDREGVSYKKPGHRLGSAYEQELEKKIRSITKFNSEINDLSEKLVDKYNEREKEFQQNYADMENKASQLIASSTKLEDKELEQVLHDSNVVGGMVEESAQINSSEPKEIDSLRLELERVKEDLNSKEYTIECMEKGKESSDSMFKREIDILSSGRLKLIDENRSLRDQLVSKKDNEVEPPHSPMNNSLQHGPEGTLSTPNPSSQIISVGGAEAVSLPATVPVITSSLMSPTLIYSILTLVLIAIIWFMARKWWNSRKKSNQYSTYGNYINSDHVKRLLARLDFYYLNS
ncbi:unnamed protein product [Rhizophagus irregularis]|nr:unnamed protein product [Rhizophagus irregularis]